MSLLVYALKAHKDALVVLAEKARGESREHASAALEALTREGVEFNDARTVHNYNWNMDQSSREDGKEVAYQDAAKRVGELIEAAERVI